ncbi:hypothetical protein SISSUDRAFT_1029949 [Sistotremastrum suecicum HHB10207 ss-3]|uniref:Zn(2)-C6 fungal-type domain-containing protein n=1 Tax=Sistotremastrum suecicum HHB10207 ss-3 TaxID=1314776 RepID=A0A166I6E3_9AGAM|nr:hypothetical protein SISSUDRAFT_1029949 [Sistotremastrum suecicum HHB10207 ss-3]
MPLRSATCLTLLGVQFRALTMSEQEEVLGSWLVCVRSTTCARSVEPEKLDSIQICTQTWNQKYQHRASILVIPVGAAKKIVRVATRLIALKVLALSRNVMTTSLAGIARKAKQEAASFLAFAKTAHMSTKRSRSKKRRCDANRPICARCAKANIPGDCRWDVPVNIDEGRGLLESPIHPSTAVSESFSIVTLDTVTIGAGEDHTIVRQDPELASHSNLGSARTQSSNSLELFHHHFTKWAPITAGAQSPYDNRDTEQLGFLSPASLEAELLVGTGDNLHPVLHHAIQLWGLFFAESDPLNLEVQFANSATQVFTDSIRISNSDFSQVVQATCLFGVYFSVVGRILEGKSYLDKANAFVRRGLSSDPHPPAVHTSPSEPIQVTLSKEAVAFASYVDESISAATGLAPSLGSHELGSEEGTDHWCRTRSVGLFRRSCQLALQWNIRDILDDWWPQVFQLEFEVLEFLHTQHRSPSESWDNFSPENRRSSIVALTLAWSASLRVHQCLSRTSADSCFKCLLAMQNIVELNELLLETDYSFLDPILICCWAWVIDAVYRERQLQPFFRGGGRDGSGKFTVTEIIERLIAAIAKFRPLYPVLYGKEA